MKKHRLVFAFGGLGLFASVLWVSAQNPVPPGYADRVRQYRTQATGMWGGENVNNGTPRTVSTFLPPENDTAPTVITVPNTDTITTNLVSAGSPDGIYVPPGTNVIVSISHDTDIPIRAMTVTVVFRSEFPLKPDGPIQLTLAKDSVTPVLLGLTPSGEDVSTDQAGGYVGTVTFDPLALKDITQYADFIKFEADVTATVKLSGGADYSNFTTNQNTKGTWSLKFANPATSTSSNSLHSFTINVTSDPKSIVVGGKVYDLRSRKVQVANPSKFNADGTEVFPIPRSASER
ncbi:MAG: hypothetical protein IT578_03465 [Verrucomicrobiae bacterium]|nr:hypothetical protein [Verrucomicrobiae bacterium]